MEIILKEITSAKRNCYSKLFEINCKNQDFLRGELSALTALEKSIKILQENPNAEHVF